MFEYKGTPQGSKWPVVSAIKASRMLIKGCVKYLASIVDTTKKVVTELIDVCVVCKFLDVFPEELSGYHYLERRQYPKPLIEWLLQS